MPHSGYFSPLNMKYKKVSKYFIGFFYDFYVMILGNERTQIYFEIEKEEENISCGSLDKRCSP